MGLAASQARYLDITARKSNVEFQGQMINQQRTELANESAGIFQEMLTIDPPVAPTQANYKQTSYTFEGTNYSYQMYDYKKIDGTENQYRVKMEYNNGQGTASNPIYSTAEGVAILNFQNTQKPNMVTSLQMVSFDPGYKDAEDDIGYIEYQTSTSSRIDTVAYEQAMNQHEYEKAQYQKKLSELQARTQEIQVQDRTLELQLRQLDTEQEALQTELESVKKVIESSIDQIFKTFQS